MNKGSKSGKLLFVTGTDTGVGKTVITAGLLAVFSQQGYRTVAIKPFQTGIQANSGEAYFSDVMFYRKTALLDEPESLLNPVALEPPASPWVAAMLSKTVVDLTKVCCTIEEFSSRYDLIILEGAGGLCVPIHKNFLIADFVRELKCPLLIVARSSLGTINHTLLTVNLARAKGIPISGVVVNGLRKDADPVESLNPWVIKELSGVPLLGTLPFSPEIDVEAGKMGNLAELVEKHLDISKLEETIFGKS